MAGADDGRIPPAPRWRRWTLLGAAACMLVSAGTLVAQQPAFLGIKILTNGYVGVGTATPQATLHVVGDTMVTGTIRGQNYLGRYGNAAVIKGFSASGTTDTPFVIVYNDTTPNQPPTITFVNTATNIFKNFIIDHPLDPSRYLVHATLEGPEGAVYYRGSAHLDHGRAEIALPSYFEALTRRDGRTVQLTNIDGFDPIAVLRQDGASVRDGRFVVGSSNAESTQAFDWEVKAVRADGPPLVAEPRRDEIAVAGFGPYTFIAGRR
jgi:hypothetical protein